MKRYIRIIIIFFTILPLISCACTRRKAAAPREYYSGIMRIDDQGKPYFTDCTTRIRMEISLQGQYEALRREYGLEDITDREPLVLTFYGRLVNPQPLTPDDDSPLERYPLTDIEVRVDSLLSLTRAPDCVSDYMVPGLYRKIHHGKAEILRLRPDYTFSIENLSDAGGGPLRQGRWYRTSEMTIELLAEPEGSVTPFQIIPAQESIAATERGATTVYKKEWL
ncbi:MAG: hypothetical protein LIO77_08395 [Rikenellaceae bacterium]|nr:hypothetical protein [Rikenellaceae bacterium]